MMAKLWRGFMEHESLGAKRHFAGSPFDYDVHLRTVFQATTCLNLIVIFLPLSSHD
jgi:hypothetical protein